MVKRVNWDQRKDAILDILWLYYPIEITSAQLRHDLMLWEWYLAPSAVRRCCIELFGDRRITCSTVGGDYYWGYIYPQNEQELIAYARNRE